MKQTLHKKIHLVLLCTLLTNLIVGSVSAQSTATPIQAPAPQSKIEKNAFTHLSRFIQSSYSYYRYPDKYFQQKQKLIFKIY